MGSTLPMVMWLHHHPPAAPSSQGLLNALPSDHLSKSSMAVKKHHGVLRLGQNIHVFCRFSFPWHVGLGILYLGRIAAVGHTVVPGAHSLEW